MSDELSFGAWLRRWRKRHDLTQAELAAKVGCALGTLRNIETESARPSKQLAVRLARALGVAEADIPGVVAFARGTGPLAAPAVSAPTLHGATLNPIADTAGELPAQLTGLIGRTTLINDLRLLLLRPDVRLVTLTGPGGTGKTRVALEVAALLREHFANAVLLVELAALIDPALVLPTIAQSLGLNPSGAQPLEAQLVSALRSQAQLLLLDNFEQVAAAAPAVASLLAACPQLKVLVTSRVALGLTGEYEWPVPPLLLPDRVQPPPVAQLGQYEAVRLFTERARAANPQFTLNATNGVAVVEICHALDGLPLAIELAAAWVRLFEPQTLLARLDRRLALLVGGGADRPQRQQTMRNTIEWSYQLLTPSEQTLLRRFAVFAGRAALAAIEEICGDGSDDILPQALALVRQGMLRMLPEASDVGAREPQLGMFETIREYAWEQLVGHVDAEATRRRHAMYYLKFAQKTREAQLIGATVDRLRREHDNLRAALQWACDTGDSAIGLQLAVALARFWRSYGYSSEGRVWFTQLLALEHREEATSLALRQQALHAAAWLASDQQDYLQATRLFEDWAAVRRAMGITAGETDLLLNEARKARTEGNYRHATALYEKLYRRYQAMQERTVADYHSQELSFEEVGQVLRELGLVRREQGDFAGAAALFEEGLRLHQASGDRVSTAFSLLGLADVARDQGEAAAVREYADPSLAILRELDMRWAIGFALNTLVQGAIVDGNLSRASRLVSESVALFRDLNASGSLTEILITYATVLRLQGEIAAAEAALRESAQLAQAGGPRLFLAAAMEGIACLLIIERGEAVPGLQLLTTAASLRAEMGTPVRPIDRPRLEAAKAAAHLQIGSP